jgi:hypothetical protein
MSINFMILGATDQKLWVFEFFRRSLGRSGMYWSQPARVDHMCKKWRVGGNKNSKKKEQSLTGLGVDPQPVGDRWSPTVGRL